MPNTDINPSTPTFSSHYLRISSYLSELLDYYATLPIKSSDSPLIKIPSHHETFSRDLESIDTIFNERFFTSNPENIPIPKDHTKLVVVLDLDETLVRAGRDFNDDEANEDENTEINYKRAFATQLIEYLGQLDSIILIIWSAGTSAHIASCLNVLDPNHHIKYIIYRNYRTKLEASTPDYSTTSITDLFAISWVPAEVSLKSGFNNSKLAIYDQVKLLSWLKNCPGRAVLIDNSPYAIANPLHPLTPEIFDNITAAIHVSDLEKPEYPYLPDYTLLKIFFIVMDIHRYLFSGSNRTVAQAISHLSSQAPITPLSKSCTNDNLAQPNELGLSQYEYYGLIQNFIDEINNKIYLHDETIKVTLPANTKYLKLTEVSRITRYSNSFATPYSPISSISTMSTMSAVSFIRSPALDTPTLNQQTRPTTNPSLSQTKTTNSRKPPVCGIKFSPLTFLRQAFSSSNDKKAQKEQDKKTSRAPCTALQARCPEI